MKEIALNILDIVRNSVRAEAKNIRIEILESDRTNSLVVKIIDDGIGMENSFLEKVDDPYTTSRKTRKVGMGIPLLKHHAEMTNGSFQIRSEIKKGTIVEASFEKNHIDRQPLGDICGVLKMLFISEKDIAFEYYHSTDTGEYKFTTQEAKEVLEIEDFSDLSLLKDVINLLKTNLISINAEIT